MKLPNLRELIKYHSYHISTFAGFADVTVDLLQAALRGEEELTLGELLGIARYSGVPIGVLRCTRLIYLNKGRRKHEKMVGQLSEKLKQIWKAQKAGSKEAETYMRYHRPDLVNLQLDFRNSGRVTYCRYLAVMHKLDDTLLFIRNEQHKPRGRKVG